MRNNVGMFFTPNQIPLKCSSIADLWFYLLQEVRGQLEENLKEVSSCPSQEAPIQEQGRAGQGGGPGLYKVVKTGPSGHNIRSCPNLRGIPIGMLVLGNKVKAIGEVRTHPPMMNVFLWLDLNKSDCFMKLLSLSEPRETDWSVMFKDCDLCSSCFWVWVFLLLCLNNSMAATFSHYCWPTNLVFVLIHCSFRVSCSAAFTVEPLCSFTVFSCTFNKSVSILWTV